MSGAEQLEPELTEVPEGWSISTVGELVSASQYGTSAKANADGLKGIPVLRMGNIQDGRLDLTDLKYLPRSTELKGLALAPGDILFNRTNSPDLVGKSAVVDTTRELTFASYLIRLRVRTDLVDPKLLCWWINSPWGRHWAAYVRTDGVSQSNINGTKLAEMVAPLPPRTEQHRIVEKVEALLEQVNRAKDRLDRVPLILKRFRQAVLAAACSGELTKEWRTAQAAPKRPNPQRPAPPNDLPDYVEHLDGHDFPETWELVRVDRLAAIQNGRAFPSKEYMDRGGVRLLRPGNLHVRGVVEWTDDNTVSLPRKWMTDFPDFVLGEGELLMNLTAQSLKDEFLGRACIKSDPEPALLNQRIARLSPLGGYDVRPYLLAYFKSKFFRHHVNGLDTGSLIRHMHSKDVARHVVPLPPEDEQVEILSLVRKMMALAEAVERRVDIATARAQKLPQAILSKAFSGELVATEAELARLEGRTYETATELLRRLQPAPTISRSKPTSKKVRRGEEVEA